MKKDAFESGGQKNGRESFDMACIQSVNEEDDLNVSRQVYTYIIFPLSKQSLWHLLKLQFQLNLTKIFEPSFRSRNLAIVSTAVIF